MIGGAGDDVIGGGSGDGARLRDLSCGQGEDFLSSLPGGDFLPDDCELLELRSFRTSYPRMIDGHPRFDLTRRPDNPVSCRVRVEVRTMGGRLLARGAKRTDNRAVRVTAVLTATGRGAERPRDTAARRGGVPSGELSWLVRCRRTLRCAAVTHGSARGSPAPRCVARW